MKKIVLLLFVVCAAMTASAQVYVGGTAGIWRNDDAKTTDFSIMPEIGYNINDSWAIGAELGYKQEQAVGKTKTFAIAPYARYTYLESGIVRLFLDGTVGYASTKLGDAKRENGFQIGIKPGIAIELTEKFCLVGKLGFAGYRDDYGMGEGHSNGFGLGVSGADLSVGFYVSF